MYLVVVLVSLFVSRLFFGAAVTIDREASKLVVNAVEPFSKRYLKVGLFCASCAHPFFQTAACIWFLLETKYVVMSPTALVVCVFLVHFDILVDVPMPSHAAIVVCST